MRRAYVAPILDLSLPIPDSAAPALAEGLQRAMRELARRPYQRASIALAGGVTSALLRAGEERALQLVAERASAGQVFFLATACYGAFLPLLRLPEAERQLDLDDEVNREALGEWVFRPDGLFPPQLGYSRSVADLARRRGLPRIVADDLAYHGGSRPLPRDRHFTLRGTAGFHVFFADRLLSSSLAEGQLKDLKALHGMLASRTSGYAVIRVPGRLLLPGGPGVEFLSSLGTDPDVLPASLDELLALFPEFEAVEPLPCALGTEPAELAAGLQFSKWSAPDNELHALLWKLANLASRESERLASEGQHDNVAPGRLRALLDESLDCAAWRFASGRPELDPRRVEEGGARLLASLRAGEGSVRPEVRAEAERAFERLRQRCAELAGRYEEAFAPA